MPPNPRILLVSRQILVHPIHNLKIHKGANQSTDRHTDDGKNSNDQSKIHDVKR